MMNNLLDTEAPTTCWCGAPGPLNTYGDCAACEAAGEAEAAWEAAVGVCPICDALGHGFPGGPICPLESPDPGYYADEMAAGR